MAYCKKFIVLFLILFILFFNVSSCFATEESTDPIVEEKNNVVLSQSGTLSNGSNYITYFLTLEDGYSYDITLSTPSGQDIRTGFTNSTSVGTTIYNYSAVSNDFSITINSNDYEYFYFDFGGIRATETINYTINKYPSRSLDSAVSGLVNNVGPNAFWGVFGSGIDFVFVVVIVAFGIFIVVKLIKGLSKGKSKI